MAKKRTKSNEITTLAYSSSNSRNLNKRIYTVPELMRLTKRSRRQLIYWEQISLLKPKFRDQKATGSKPRAFYSAKEAVKALIVSDMLDRGLSLQQVQKVAQNLEKHSIQLDESENYLLTDGNTVLYAENNDRVIDILKHEGQMLLVPIHEQVEKLKQVA
jgi:DNA-binding transcriptional MerR regulator